MPVVSSLMTQNMPVAWATLTGTRRVVGGGSGCTACVVMELPFAGGCTVSRPPAAAAQGSRVAPVDEERLPVGPVVGRPPPAGSCDYSGWSTEWMHEPVGNDDGAPWAGAGGLADWR